MYAATPLWPLVLPRRSIVAEGRCRPAVARSPGPAAVGAHGPGQSPGRRCRRARRQRPRRALRRARRRRHRRRRRRRAVLPRRHRRHRRRRAERAGAAVPGAAGRPVSRADAAHAGQLGPRPGAAVDGHRIGPRRRRLGAGAAAAAARAVAAGGPIARRAYRRRDRSARAVVAARRGRLRPPGSGRRPRRVLRARRHPRRLSARRDLADPHRVRRRLVESIRRFDPGTQRSVETARPVPGRAGTRERPTRPTAGGAAATPPSSTTSRPAPAASSPCPSPTRRWLPIERTLDRSHRRATTTRSDRIEHAADAAAAGAAVHDARRSRRRGWPAASR